MGSRRETLNPKTTIYYRAYNIKIHTDNGGEFVQ